MFTIEFTSLAFPPSTPSVSVTPVVQFQDAEVIIPRNDHRTAKFTLSIFDPILTAVRTMMGAPLPAYRTIVKISYRGYLLFRGLVTQPEWDSESGRVTVNAVGPSLRLDFSPLRLGDRAISKTNGFKGLLPVDHRGLQMLLEAGYITPAQSAAGWPDLGIQLGTNYGGVESIVRMKVDRGAESFRSMKELAASTEGPDFDVNPVDDPVNNPLVYAWLDTWYPSQGVDRAGNPAAVPPVPSTILFQDGHGKNNVKKTTWTPGGKIITHAHVLSQNGELRRTSVDSDSAGLHGPYVHWEATEFEGGQAVSAGLKAIGDEIVNAYGLPPDFMTIELLPDILMDHQFPDHFGLGDRVAVDIQRGEMIDTSSPRITQVAVRQANNEEFCTVALDVEPYHSSGTFSDT